MNSSLLNHPVRKKFTSYRNIATCSPSQNLFDDIIAPEHFSDLEQHERSSSDINHNKDKKCRPFQYADAGTTLAVFEKINWRYGRFSNGTEYGVWYGALKEETSIHEIVYYRLQESRELFNNPKIVDPFIVSQRALFKAQCLSSKIIDLMKNESLYAALTDNDYNFCQSLGQSAVTKKIDGFFTPSARHRGGTCTPIFNPEIINDQFVYYFDIIIHRNEKIEFKKSEIKPWPHP